MGNRPIVLKKSKWEDRAINSEKRQNAAAMGGMAMGGGLGGGGGLKYEHVGGQKNKNLKKFKRIKKPGGGGAGGVQKD